MLVMLSSMTLTACAKISSIAISLSPETLEQAVKKVTCESIRPVYFSASRDTAKTIVQVRGNNAALEAICEEKP